MKPWEVELELALFSSFHFHFRTGCIMLASSTPCNGLEIKTNAMLVDF
jgi:hypothetical protein